MINLSSVYIDWPNAPEWATRATLTVQDETGEKIADFSEWKRPKEMTMDRAQIEREVRLHYRMPPARIGKLKTETLVDLLNGMGKLVKP